MRGASIGIMKKASSARQTAERSPLLAHILGGDESTVLDLYRLDRQREAGQPALFDAPAFNRAVLLKFPSFQIPIAHQSRLDYGTETSWIAHTRPIQTALYVPRDRDRPERGGYGMQVRAADFPALLKLHLGVDLTDSAASTDMVRLSVVDSTPSLDRFLLASELSDRGLPVSPHLARSSKADETVLKQMIVKRMMPIIREALGAAAGGLSEGVQRFIQATWQTETSEARAFIAAFRIDQPPAGEIIRAWKGVNFFQIRFEKIFPRLQEFSGWLVSDSSIPNDMQMHREYRQQVESARSLVTNRLHACMQKLRQIARDQDQAYERFLDHRDPAGLQNYFRTVSARYWVAAYCYMSLVHVLAIFEDAMKTSKTGTLPYQQATRLFTDMTTLLDSRLSLQQLC